MTNEPVICIIQAMTQPRRDRYGAYHVGILLKDYATREMVGWTNYYFQDRRPLKWGDMVRCTDKAIDKIEFSDLAF